MREDGRTDGHEANSRFSQFWFDYRNFFSQSSRIFFVFSWAQVRLLSCLYSVVRERERESA